MSICVSSNPATSVPVKCPTVSVVIIFLNAQKFLTEAIESVLAQTFTDWELFLVDDGSTDRSTTIAHSYVQRDPDRIHYLEHPGHENRGMSASRNLGISQACGQLVALLDADDVWFPEKLDHQVSIMTRYPEAGLLANPSLYWYEDGVRKLQPMTLSAGVLQPGAWIPKILENDNNAACPSSVLIRVSLLKSVSGFEESFLGPLMVFEDQVTWFKATLAGSVYFDPEPLILYRIHTESCCMSTPSDQQRLARLVLYSRLRELLRKDGNLCSSRALLSTMARARQCELLLQSANHNPAASQIPDTTSATANRHSVGPLFSGLLLLGRVSKTSATEILSVVFHVCHVAYHDGVVKTIPATLRFLSNTVRRMTPAPARQFARQIRNCKRRVAARLQLGRSVRPLSEVWATDRGVPIHRYYLARFLQECRSDVRGHCLEFQDNTYTTRVGGRAVTKVDILHIDRSNRQATIVVDLTKPNDIPSDKFDCVICTHVLHVVPEVDKAVSELHRILKPGGTLLVAVPQLSMCDPGWHELWRFTPEGLCLLLARAFGKENVQVQPYGNSLASAYEIRGIASEEVSRSVLDFQDPRFAIEVCARAVKQ